MRRNMRRIPFGNVKLSAEYSHYGAFCQREEQRRIKSLQEDRDAAVLHLNVE